MTIDELLETGKTRGYVLLDEIDDLLPENYEGGPELDDLLSAIEGSGLEILEESKSEPETSADLGDETDDPVRVYLREVGKVPPLTRDRELELAKLIRGGQPQDKAARELIEANVRLVVSIAMRYANHGRHVLELIQEGNAALMSAVQKFEPLRGYRFSTYAAWLVHRSMRRGSNPAPPTST